MYEKILVPIDGSDTATLGLRESIKLARNTGGAIRLIQILNELLAVSQPVSAAGTDIVVDQLRAGGESILKDAAAATRDAGVPVDSKSRRWAAWRGPTYLQEAQTWPADLIVRARQPVIRQRGLLSLSL